MPVNLTEPDLYARLFTDEATVCFLTGRAELDAMLTVEAALAEVQGELGLIPAAAAAAIAQAARGLAIRAEDLAAQVAIDGVPVPALVATLRATLPPEHARWVHWGATSQDILDTSLNLRLTAMLEAWAAPFRDATVRLGVLARAHATTPMAARTYGQIAVPTSFGAVAASWGRPLLLHRDRLACIALPISLGGAAGTLSAMGGRGPDVRAALASRLGLRDPGASWHGERGPVGDVAFALAALLGSLGKMGEDLLLLTQSGIDEVRVAGPGGSSTMPQKENPVGPSVLVALARAGLGLAATLQSGALHRQQRDGAAWFTEWLTLPPLCATAGRALALGADLAGRIRPDASAMARNMEAGGGAIHAEALTFALSARMPRPDAVAVVRALAAEAEGGGRLPDLVRRDHPDLDWAGPDLGQAPAEAMTFAQAAGA